MPHALQTFSVLFFFFQAEDGIRDLIVTGVQTCALPIWSKVAYTEREKRYQGGAATCDACPLKPQCTISEHGRLLKRSFDEEYLDRVRAYHTTEAYLKAMRKRQVWVEPLFAEAKDWHGMRRFRLRRLWRVNIEALLVAAGQNLKRLLKKWGWGRRPWPEGAVYAAPH